MTEEEFEKIKKWYGSDPGFVDADSAQFIQADAARQLTRIAEALESLVDKKLNTPTKGGG